jgi:hypothetical protein
MRIFPKSHKVQPFIGRDRTFVCRESKNVVRCFFCLLFENEFYNITKEKQKGHQGIRIDSSVRSSTLPPLAEFMATDALKDARTRSLHNAKGGIGMKHSYPTLETLKFLLEMIHNRVMALPDFQRDFVWDPLATDELIESLISNYPAGSLLRIKNGQQLLFQPRAFEGAPELDDENKPVYLILDGQQRLTSLYQAFYGVGEHRFYLNLDDLEKGKDLEDCAFYMRTKDGEKLYGTTEQQAVALVFPMARMFGTQGGFSTWQNQVLRIRGGEAKAILDLQERLTKLHEKWIKPIEEYEFPMVTLSEETSGPAVCMIFETLNRTGVKLSVFDLLTARFWPLDFNLRKKWSEAKEEYSILEEFKIDPYYVLQIIALLEPGHDKDGRLLAPSVRRSAILDMSVNQAQQGWDIAVKGLAEALGILRDECGILVPDLLPYNTVVIPMAAAWVTQQETSGADLGANRLRIIRWFWCSVFGQKYENAPNSQAEKDFGELRYWLHGGQSPESVSEFRLELDLKEVRPRQRAVYRGVMALILQNGAIDFHKRGRINSQLFYDKKNPIDDHHIFPRAFLDQQGVSIPLRDCILNRTFIDRETNRRLSRRAPSDYFGEIRTKHGSKDTDEMLRSHLLPDGDFSPLLKDDFTQFLDWRDQAFRKLIVSRTQ